MGPDDDSSVFIWIMQITLLSVIFITLSHFLFQFVAKSLTTYKEKDLLEGPIQRYDEIIKTLNHEKSTVVEMKMDSEDLKTSNIDDLPGYHIEGYHGSFNDDSSITSVNTTNKETMKAELQNYIQSELLS